MRYTGVFFSLLLVLSTTGFSQEAPENPEPLPQGFRSILLGMGLEEVKETLIGDVYFNYRGEPDVSLLPEPNRTMIDTEGAVYIQRGYFQFFNEVLYIINLELNEGHVDYYSMYTTLVEKYGQPGALDNTQAIWENESVRLSLEKPLTVKYIKKDVFEEILSQGKIEQSAAALSRDTFLSQF